MKHKLKDWYRLLCPYCEFLMDCPTSKAMKDGFNVGYALCTKCRKLFKFRIHPDLDGKYMVAEKLSDLTIENELKKLEDLKDGC
jgi:hypothetical protein